jgi:hypothetical protein
MEKKFVGPSLLIVTVMGCLLLTRDANGTQLPSGTHARFRVLRSSHFGHNRAIHDQ